MKLFIDGIETEAMPGESLLCIIKRLGLDCSELSKRPLAARIAGETFTLNYIPVREKDSGGVQTPSMRKAMEASDGKIRLIRYGEQRGKRVYERTAQFVLLLAIRMLFPGSTAKINYSIGAGLYVTVDKTPAFKAEDVPKLKQKFAELVKKDIPLNRRRFPIDEASGYFMKDGQADKVQLLKWRDFTYLDTYSYLDYMDYFYGEMAPSSGYISIWDIFPHKNGLVLVRPDNADPDRPAKYTELKNFSNVFENSNRWCSLMKCEFVSDLNAMVRDGSIRDLIRLNEALHEKRFAEIAEDIISRGAKIVFIAGPSSSGKTTSANRLSVQLRVQGKQPSLISLDDYYIDRNLMTPLPDGSYDLEHINAIDVAQIKADVSAFLSGNTINVPRFDFTVQRRVVSNKFLTMEKDSVLIIEGIHGLNPLLIPNSVDKNLIFRMYVSALLPLNLDNHNRIPTTYLRLLRRIVRDYETRGMSVERTFAMWDSVRRGEERWIFPYQENADVIFDSSLIYELAVLKKHIFPLLNAITPDDPYYSEIRSIVKILNYFVEADVDDEVPPTSILREFIGKNSFYK